MTLVYHSSKLKATVDLLLSKSVVKHFALSSVGVSGTFPVHRIDGGFFYICDWILVNSFKSHIFISVYLSLQHEKYCIPNNIS